MKCSIAAATLLLSSITATAQLDCSFQNVFPVRDPDIQLQQIIDPVKSTVTVQLEYAGQGWLGFAFSEAIQMIPNVAAIGLPDEGTVQKYELLARDISGVNPLDDVLQTLTDTSISQNDTHTVMKFTKPLVEDSEVPVVLGSNTFIWAHGETNTLAYHGANNRGGVTIPFDECVETVAAPVPVPATPPSPYFEPPEEAPTSPTGDAMAPDTTSGVRGVVESGAMVVFCGLALLHMMMFK